MYSPYLLDADCNQNTFPTHFSKLVSVTLFAKNLNSTNEIPIQFRQVQYFSNMHDELHSAASVHFLFFCTGKRFEEVCLAFATDCPYVSEDEFCSPCQFFLLMKIWL